MAESIGHGEGKTVTVGTSACEHGSGGRGVALQMFLMWVVVGLMAGTS